MLNKLITLIESREEAGAEASYVASLLHAPIKKVAQKVAEEGVEVAMAAVSEDKNALTYEIADLMFHMLVLCQKSGIAFEDVVKELERREGVSGHAEKASRRES